MAFVFVWLVIMAGKFSLAIYDHSISAFHSFIIKQKETLLLIALQGKVWIRSEIKTEGNSVADSLARKGLDTLRDCIAWF